MVMDNLGQSLRDALKKIANAPHIDKKLVQEVLKDIQRALLKADVNVKLVLALTKDVEKRALTEKPKPGMSSREHVIKIIYEELLKVLGTQREIPLKRQRIMMVGLYGQGKTTTSGKLARYFTKKGLSSALIAADVHRPAAYDQLKQIGDLINVPVYGDPEEKNAVKIVKKGLEEFKNIDVVIIDTSGRHSLEDDLIKEITDIEKIAKADEKLLVMDAAVGQQAGPQAKAFHEAVNITGVIITKLDGTAKGGGALSAVAETKAPIVFIGTGEHIRDLEKFDANRFLSRLLGMGDIESLMEKVSEALSENDAEESMRSMMHGRFTLKEMYAQLEMMGNMGPLKSILTSIPGFAGKISDEEMEETQRKLYWYKIIMDSMTEYEKENPKEIKSSRVKRIARGAGVDPREVRDLLKQYNNSKKTMKTITGNRKMRRQLMKQLGNLDLK